MPYLGMNEWRQKLASRTRLKDSFRVRVETEIYHALSIFRRLKILGRSNSCRKTRPETVR